MKWRATLRPEGDADKHLDCEAATPSKAWARVLSVMSSTTNERKTDDRN